MPNFISQPVDKLRVYTNSAAKKNINITACISVECLLYKIKAQFRYK